MTNDRSFDEINAKILTILQEDARISNAEVARRVGLAPSGVFERIRKLEERGIIRGYSAQLDPTALGLGLLAFVFVRAHEGVGATKTADQLARIAEVQEVHHVAGEDCFLVKVRATDAADLGRLLRDEIGAVKTVRSTRTTIVLGTAKESPHVAVRVTKKGRARRAERGRG